jgi:hypothetical protein
MQEIEHLVTLDTRECIGELSLKESRLLFLYRNFHSIDDVSKILSTSNSIDDTKLLNTCHKLLKNYNGETEYSSLIVDNKIKFKFRKNIKNIFSFDIVNISIPRDIIPMYVYFPNFINNCLYKKKLNFISSRTPGYDSPIPASQPDFEYISGLYQTPLRYFRTYHEAYSMPNSHTPPPYQMWNPPQDNISPDPWPFQPQPKKQQRCPTYRAKNGLIFSGFGLYDLDDFPHLQTITLNDGVIIQIPMRKIILKMIIPEGQYIDGNSSKYIIENSRDNDFGADGIVDNPLTQTGYGDYQRFIPGPGLGMNYQPNQPRANKSAPIDLGISTYDSITGYLGPMPTPFPNFRGNCWGPYCRPGDRFQNSGLQDTIDELYLNGDLSNIGGVSIINPVYNPTEGPYTFEMMMENVSRLYSDDITFTNFESSQNPNIVNSMRINYDGGFGAVQTYIGMNMTERGKPGNIVTNGLPNTQYDGVFHKFNSEIWMKKKSMNPLNWEDSLPGPQKPSIVEHNDFKGWMYSWRTFIDISGTPTFSGSIYVPVTAGGVGPMEYSDMDSVSPQWKKSEGSLSDSYYSTGSCQWTHSPVIGCSNYWRIPTSGDTIKIGNIPWGYVISIIVISLGTGWYPISEIDTENLTGDGDGLTVSITGSVITVKNSGSGYKIGDRVSLFGDTILEITDVYVNENPIPSENVTHYIDPIASGCVTVGTTKDTRDYVNGIRMNVPCDNYQEPQGYHVFTEGSVCCENSNSTHDPRPNLLPISLLKCDFGNLPSPAMEWESGSKTNRPLDNNRIRQLNNYINMRVSYNVFSTGKLIESVGKYLKFLEKSIRDTDIIININQLKRTIHTQSINDTTDQSNFNIPIRLNTNNYIENQQQFLSKYNNRIWSTFCFPYIGSLNFLELEFFTYDGTPIPLERNLGFSRKIMDTSVLFSPTGTTNIFLDQPYHQSDNPNSVFVTSSGIMISGDPMTVSGDHSIDPRTVNFTKTNISITFKFSTYNNYSDHGIEENSEEIRETPKASNIYYY